MKWVTGLDVNSLNRATVLTAVRPNFYSYESLCALVTTGLLDIGEICDLALELVYQENFEDRRLVQIANSLSDEMRDMEIAMNYEGTYILHADYDSRNIVTSIWLALKIQSKQEMRLGSVGRDLKDEFAEICKSETDWPFPIAVAGSAKFGRWNRERSWRAEESEAEMLFAGLFRNQDIAHQLLAKMKYLNRSWNTHSTREA